MILEESQLFRDLMRLKPDGWTANAWAVRAGVSRTVWTDMRRHGNPARRTLEKLLTVAGSSLAEFEALRIGARQDADRVDQGLAVADRNAPPWHGRTLPPLPVVAASPGGQWSAGEIEVELTELESGSILERLPRPASLSDDPGAFAFAVVSGAMWPRFRPGRRIAVSPKATVETGEDVLVTLASEPGGRSSVLIAELVERSADQIALRQFHPEVTFRIAADQVSAVGKVMGELF
jgi:hypothetical protein